MPPFGNEEDTSYGERKLWQRNAGANMAGDGCHPSIFRMRALKPTWICSGNLFYHQSTIDGHTGDLCDLKRNYWSVTGRLLEWFPEERTKDEPNRWCVA